MSGVIRDDFPVESVNMQLQHMVAEARRYVLTERHQDEQLGKLLDLFYTQWGFSGAGGVYALSDALWLDTVLKTRRGTAISLGILLLHFAEQLDLPLMPVVFPTQLILRADWLDGDMWLINPFNGEKLEEKTLKIWLKGELYSEEALCEEDVEEAEPSVVLRKVLHTLKMALMEEKRAEIALNVSNLLLQISPNDPYEIRDRGLIYAQLDCGHLATIDLSYFLEHCPNDPLSEMIRMQLRTIKEKQPTLH